MKARVIKRTRPDGVVCYVIQQPHFLLKWIWVDARHNLLGAQDSFGSLEEAQKNLCWFDGTGFKEEVVG
jgi:hypothetical protein